jgi:tetratricopeptide (TPR) repeat protein
MNELEDNGGLNGIRENVLKVYDELKSNYISTGEDITKRPFYQTFSSLFQEKNVITAKDDEKADHPKPIKIQDQVVKKERDEAILSKPPPVNEIEEADLKKLIEGEGRERQEAGEAVPTEPSADEDEIFQWLEEAQIYTEQGLYSEAEELYRRILRVSPQDEFVTSQLKGLEGKIKGLVSAKDVSDAFSKYKILKNGDEFDVGNLAQQITAQIDKESEKADLKIHYELGLAYRELGLFDEALEEFHIAVKDPKWEFESYSAMAECQMEKGTYDDAIKNFQKALNNQGLSKSAILEINYELGRAYESNGMAKEALATYHQVALMDRNFKDVREKLKILKS